MAVDTAEDRAACPAVHCAQRHAEDPFFCPHGIKVAARLKRPANHPSLRPPTPLQHGRGSSQCQCRLRFPGKPLSMDRAALWDAKAQPGLSRYAGGSSGLGRGPPAPLHPRGVAVASPEPFKEARYAPGPWPAAAQDYTWKSSAAGSASASVAAGPDRE